MRMLNEAIEYQAAMSFAHLSLVSAHRAAAQQRGKPASFCLKSGRLNAIQPAISSSYCRLVERARRGALVAAVMGLAALVGAAQSNGAAAQETQARPEAQPETERPESLNLFETPGPEIDAAIQASIVGQIEAFQADDGALALTFAIPQARQVWRTPEIFMEMVRTAYHPIYRPAEFSFAGAVAQGGIARQVVRVTGENGQTVLALYDMYRQPNGRWLIGGVATVEVEPEEQSL